MSALALLVHARLLLRWQAVADQHVHRSMCAVYRAAAACLARSTFFAASFTCSPCHLQPNPVPSLFLADPLARPCPVCCPLSPAPRPLAHPSSALPPQVRAVPVRRRGHAGPPGARHPRPRVAAGPRAVPAVLHQDLPLPDGRVDVGQVGNNMYGTALFDARSLFVVSALCFGAETPEPKGASLLKSQCRSRQATARALIADSGPSMSRKRCEPQQAFDMQSRSEP